MKNVEKFSEEKIRKKLSELKKIHSNSVVVFCDIDKTFRVKKK
jgi:hypothetical protein